MTMNNERPRLIYSCIAGMMSWTLSGWWAEWAETRQDRIGCEGKGKRIADRGVVRRWAWQVHCARCPRLSLGVPLTAIVGFLGSFSGHLESAAWQSRHSSNRCSDGPLSHTPFRGKDNAILPSGTWPAPLPAQHRRHRWGGLSWPLR